MANYYVTRNQDGTWNAKKEHADRASSISDTQHEAEANAKEFSASSRGGEVRIQGLDHKFRDSDTVFPGNDPRSIKDMKH